MKIKAHVICHTHWDREWYFTREQFRTKLVRLIDGLLEMIETVPDYVSFMLDGQTIVIEDYLEIKPYKREELLHALRTGRILCGPWYILPDELLISGESHIRNFLAGSRVLGEEAPGMKTAYLPDSFGHPAQMPQIAEGLGMDTMVFWRGTSNAIENTEFIWQSPHSGSEILCIHMPCGYGNSGNLSEDMEETIPRVTGLLETLGEKSTTNIVLLMNGSDHVAGQKNIPRIVQMINERCLRYELVLSTMEAFIKEVKDGLKEPDTFRGEFRSAQRSMLLGGTLSTRMECKLKNDQVQKKMERYLEPMLAAEYLAGDKIDTKGWSDYLWRKILENQPHDSICGCSIDEVHREMMTRYGCVLQLEDMLMSDTAERLTQKSGNAAESAAELLLFEPSADGLPAYLEVTVQLDRMLVQKVNYTKSVIEDFETDINHPDMGEGFRITDETGRDISFVLLKQEKTYDTLYQDHTLPEIYKVNQVQAVLLLPGFSFGYHVLTIQKDEAVSERVSIDARDWIENEYYRVSASEGAFIVMDKKTGVIHGQVGKLLDLGDAGDEYTYSWPKEDRCYTWKPENLTVSREVLGSIGMALTVTGDMELPSGLLADRSGRTEEMVRCPVTMRVSLFRGIGRLDFHTCVDNQAMDHRLQVRFPAGIRSDYSESMDVFGVTKRAIKVEVPDEWAEYPQSTHPTHGFVALEDGADGMAIAAVGLTEFEAVDMGTECAVNLTLLRSVGWLSRTDLNTRKGNGGWTIETPDAQCRGHYEFDYSISYYNGSWRDARVFGLMEQRRLPSVVFPNRSGLHFEGFQEETQFLSQLPEGIRLSAFKKAENGSGLILRLFSISNRVEEVCLRLPECIASASRVNLAERQQSELKLNGRQLLFSVEACEIVTIRLETAERQQTEGKVMG